MAGNKYEAPESNVGIQSMESASLTMNEILFSFKGRIGRKTYWMFFLAFMVVLFLLVGVFSAMGLNENIMAVVMLVLYIPAIWMSLAVQVKRWHDRDKSGWWVLISFIPIIGPLWAFVENGCLAGDDGVNSFGPPSA